MKFKFSKYSTERLEKELEEARNRLKSYCIARNIIPKDSLLGSLSVACGIKAENKLIAALEEELMRRAAEYKE